MPSTSIRQPNSARPRVLCVSYDGAAEPLGRSQVVAYLIRLARDFEITLISFEKPGGDQTRMRAELNGRGIEWQPLRYHRRPPVLSTVFDVAAGRRAAIRYARLRGKPDIVHVRSYIPALIALLARRHTGGRLLFDIRGFWADERVEGGLWTAGGFLYRLAKRCERRFFGEADAIVTLTDASIPQIRAWTGARPLPIAVIPTCVEPERFAARPERPDGQHVVWCGSVGTWYRFDLASRLAKALSLPLTVITRQTHLARELLGGYPASVRAALPDRVPGEFFSGDIGLCLVKSSFSKVASAPTRFAEYLAAGMPVLVTARVGDLEALVEHHGVGVVLRGDDEGAIASAAARMHELLADPGLIERCRSLARERFDVVSGSASYAENYRRLVGGRYSGS